jgi:hypothetical protein
VVVTTALLAPESLMPVQVADSASMFSSTKTLISDFCLDERAEDEPVKEVRVFWEVVKSERT